MRLVKLVTLVPVLAGCTMGLKPEGRPPRPETVTGIQLRISEEDLAPPGDSVDTAKLADRIGKNLGAWGFPVSADAGGEPSHVMTPHVSGVEGKSTPTGFSFSAGNSDPRSLEFQKADVVTVTCTVKSAGKNSDNAYLKESFVADDLLKLKGKSNQGALFDLYVNHIGTACFNLLTELKIKRSKPDPQHVPGTVSNTWFPEVRIEVRDKPVAPATKPTVPVEGKQPETTPATKESAGTPASTATETPAVQTEIQEGETRKQMVIHNQGSPIILEFGYERK